MLTNELFYNSILLYHVNKKGGDMKADLNKILAKDNLTVDKLLNSTAKDFIKTNANEVMGTTQVGFGKEFVQETILSSELIERLQTNGSLLVDATIKLMTGKSLDIPVKGRRLRMTIGTEKVNAPTGGATDTAQVKKPGTASINLTAKKMNITIYYYDEWLEDSVIAVAEYILNAIYEAYESSIHEVLLNGDTETGANANINIIDWNTSALPDGNKTDLLMSDWIRKVAIDKDSVVDAGGNLAIENIRSARAKMWVKGLNPAKLRLVPDTQTYFDLMNLTEVETIEKFGDAATIKNWVLEALDWIKIVNREEMLRATATGEISATAGNNTKGQIAIVYTPSVFVWLRRWLTTELSRYAEDQVTWITGSARVAVTIEDEQNNIAETSPCALIVNI